MDKLKKRYLQVFESDGIDEVELKRVEIILNITLPIDFKQIATFFSGGDVGGIEFFSFTNLIYGATNIVDETIRLRNSILLPQRFIFLAEPAESIVVMDTENTPAIIWCDAVEVNKLSSGEFISQPHIFQSFSEFFTFLLNEEY